MSPRVAAPERPSVPLPIRLGVSSCLLGQEVRYDGGHKRDRYLTDDLADYFEWVPVCPELEAGMGVPRPALRLQSGSGEVRLVEIKSGADRTDELERFSAKRVRALRGLSLCGYLLKKDSPSCGWTRVKVWNPKGMAERKGQGLFARALCEAFPGLPVEEEGRLRDAALRENFIERVFAYARLKQLFTGRWTAGRVVAFHTAHKLQLMAHSPAAYRTLGALVAEVAKTSRAEFRDQYEHLFMEALEKRATRGRNANVLNHCAGYFKKRIDPDARAELADLVEEYRQGFVPLVVPITLIRHHARMHDTAYLAGQTYLEPHPKELMLRNHV
ncbi:MAG: DUF523 and DUF1722 domain-containing protein [Myxococcota bacterium]